MGIEKMNIDRIAAEETRKCAIALFNDETDSRAGTILAHIKSAIEKAVAEQREKDFGWTRKMFKDAMEIELHPSTLDLVTRFSRALIEKLSKSEKKYGFTDGWVDTDWMDECRENLRHHLKKGDPLDVAAFCAFLWHHGEPTSRATHTSEPFPCG